MALSGRKRFTSDIDDLKALSKKGWEVNGIIVKGVNIYSSRDVQSLTLVQVLDPATKKALWSFD